MPRRVANAGKSSLPVSELNESTKQPSRGSLNRVVLLISISFLISGLIGLVPLMIKLPSEPGMPDVSGDLTNPSQQPSSVDIDTAEINDLTVSTSPTESEVTSTVLVPSAAPNPLLRPTETTLFHTHTLTMKPTKLPTKQPSVHPTDQPSIQPTKEPSIQPTKVSTSPTESEVTSTVLVPSAAPNPLLRPAETTLFPSQSLTVKPTKLPTKQPSLQPTKQPSLQPTKHPTRHPTTKRPTRLPTTNLPTNKPTNTEVVFHVMGDIPYKISDEACLTLDLHTLAQQQLTSNTQTNFIVHVGDVQSAQKTRCVEYGFSNARRLMQPSENSTVPIFMLAGDNDWNDCPQSDVAWGYFSNYLGRFEELWGEKKLNHLDVKKTIKPKPSIQPTKEPSIQPTKQPTSLPTTNLPTTNLPTNNPTTTEVVFHVMGDTPYNVPDEACITLDLHTLAQQQLTSTRKSNFIVHVGDMQSEVTRCVENEFSSVRRLMQPSENSTVPIFMLAGDNDWNDCPQSDVAWGYFSNYLGRFEELWGEKKLNHLDVRRQSSRDENFSMYKDGVLFLGMNIVGGAVHDAVEWMERLEDNLEWFMESVNRYNIRALVIFGHANPRNVHSGFFTPLATEIENLAIPTLYMCGDSHFWGVREKFMGVENWTKVRVDMGRYAPPVKVTVVEEEDDDLMLGVFKVECESRDTGGGCGGGAGADPTQWEQLC
eukprot:CAMPEP_0194445412 /NCGR_PEP_ID=MMETSP0176-20130528/127844_1 /TAXON_ID=216777 /ORGANISM="Proboscia alata, Strain PI-D3" /LENGTH=706 /DNA_ID=CAMNT_0039271963 /DNA_START=78 /DNA_END=2197 /DNA_ORIENTATION=-